MSRRSRAELSRGVSEALAGELIGAGIAVHEAPGVRPLPFEATIVDETQGTFELRLVPSGRRIRVAKEGLRGTLILGDRELPLNGEALRMRPQDRTKRLLQAGPMRSR